jgi:ACS family allantoate permease-like MFS transporter
MSVLASNIAGFTKKATASVRHALFRILPLFSPFTSELLRPDEEKTLMFLGYCFGQFAGPQFFIADEAPRYRTAFRMIYSTASLMIFFEIVLM